MSTTGLPRNVKGRGNASAKYLIHYVHVWKITVFINKMEDCVHFTDSDGQSDTENDLDNAEDTDDITVTRKQSVTDDLKKIITQVKNK